MERQPSTGVDKRTFAIGVLGVTACVLFVGVMLISQQPVYGLGMNDRGGDYVMATQQMSRTHEALVVIDAAAQQMLVYGFNVGAKRLEPLRPPVALAEMPKARR